VEETFPRLLSFDASQAPAVPRHAATVIVMREAGGHAGGLEVFCVLRHQRSGFLGGAVVFPGGKVDPADGADVWAELAAEPDARGAALTEASPTLRTLAVAACRETLEEASILPVDPPLADVEVDALRREATGASLAEALAKRGLRLATDRLVPWARWITPEAEARRFDARFFLLELPPGQVGRHDEHETTHSFWARPAAILERAVRGEIFLAPPTTRTLELLAAATSVRDARAIAAEQSLRPICPLFVPDDRAPFLALPGDPAHRERERRVAGATRFVLRDGRFISEDPPAINAGGPPRGGPTAP
jgi:8-oxo-dGTP pyrophosphatase MutT (NUDIX family)